MFVDWVGAMLHDYDVVQFNARVLVVCAMREMSHYYILVVHPFLPFN